LSLCAWEAAAQPVASLRVYRTPSLLDTRDFGNDPNETIGIAGVRGDLSDGNYWTVDLLASMSPGHTWTHARVLARIIDSGGVYWDHPDLDSDEPQLDLSFNGAQTLAYDSFYCLPTAPPANPTLLGFGVPRFTGPGINQPTLRGQEGDGDRSVIGRMWYIEEIEFGGEGRIIARYTVRLTDRHDALSATPSGEHNVPFMDFGDRGDESRIGDTSGVALFNMTVYHKPEPGGLALLGGAAAILLLRRRRSASCPTSPAINPKCPQPGPSRRNE
jgi:hypothetical protein